MAQTTKNLLVVEDEAVLAQALHFKFTKEGYAVLVAKNGEEAMQILRSKPIDYVILDLIMPVMNGFEVIEAIQKEKINVPLLVLSNLGQKEDIEKISALGVTDYFIKANTPISELVTIVNEKFERR